MKGNKKIKTDIAINSIVNTFLLVGFVVIFITFVLTRYIQTEHKIKNDAVANSVRFQVKTYLDQAENVLHEMRDVLYVYNLVEVDKKQEYLETVLESNTIVSRIYILNNRGEVVYNAPYNRSEVGIDHSRYPYFTNSNESDEIYWSNIFYTRVSQDPSVAISLRTNDDVIVGILDLGRLGEMLQSIDIGRGSLVAITDSIGTYVAHSNMEQVYLKLKDPYFDDYKSSNYKDNEPVLYNEDKVIPSVFFEDDIGWAVIIYQSYTELIAPIYNLVIISILIGILFLAISLYISHTKVSKITNSISDLIKGTKIISNGEYSHQLSKSGYDELETMGKYFNAMTENIKVREMRIKENEDRIRKLNESLEEQVDERTRALTQSLANLKETQNKLIQSEKMASLGELVAGITHEMKTPIGAIITLSSYLSESIKRIERKLSEQTLTKSDMQKFIENEAETVDLILNNVKRTSEFIDRLKRTSVDQMSMERKTFNLYETIKNTTVSMKMELKKNQTDIEIICPEDIILNSYPGGISQIVLNLVSNALKHGFNNQDKGKITIAVIKDENNIKLSISDDGVGIEEKLIRKIFDPFFTTAKDRGGSGLGLSLIYNLVTNLFKGTIECTSVIDEGTEFIIEFPI